jgi:hypothetical protein
MAGRRGILHEIARTEGTFAKMTNFWLFYTDI